MFQFSKKFFVVVMFFSIFNIMFSYSAQHERCKLGSGKDLKGKIVVVSIFADDINTTWGKNRINEYTNSTTKYMNIATDWITKNAKKYGSDVEFIYDYFKVGGIYYKTKFNVDLTDWKVNDAAVWKYIDQTISTKWISQTYKTDNIFFMVYVNTPKSNKVAPATRSYYNGMQKPYEIVYMNRYRDGWESAPATYAHEILHIFGARDYYYADNRNGFNKEFIDYCKTSHRNDIMYTISDVKNGGVSFEKITNELTDLDAYYLGLKNDCSEVQKFNLPKSEHFW